MRPLTWQYPRKSAFKYFKSLFFRNCSFLFRKMRHLRKFSFMPSNGNESDRKVEFVNLVLQLLADVPYWLASLSWHICSKHSISTFELLIVKKFHIINNISSLTANENHRRMSDSDKDRPLLESLMYDDKLEHPRRRHACTGRFLTMHKRRRKKLQTRALLQDTAILDDVLHGQVTVRCLHIVTLIWFYSTSHCSAFSIKLEIGDSMRSPWKRWREVSCVNPYKLRKIFKNFVPQDAHCLFYVFICSTGTACWSTLT